MKLYIDFSALEALASQLSKIRPKVVLKGVDKIFEPIDIQLQKGLEVNASEVDFDTGLLSVKGRQVLLYIKDHSFRDVFDRTLANPRNGNKFHFSHCQTLESMMQRKRYSRYVAINSNDGLFPIEGGAGKSAKARLWVCQYCLTRVNYKNSRNDTSTRSKNAQEFSQKEFFSTYSSVFKYQPKYTVDDAVGYTDEWPSISKRIRKRANYQCQQCQVSLVNHSYLCHVHHRNGSKHDNEPSNLEVLCADCHRKAHHGHMFVIHGDMQLISQLRREQHLLDNLSWDETLELVDPALKGELILFQKENYPPPLIAYPIEDTISGKSLVCEAVWPKQRVALTIKKQLINGWEIYGFGDFF